ncbi:MAG: hypothetical protein U1E93_03595 [Alphaproteobacteria bacterium]
MITAGELDRMSWTKDRYYPLFLAVCLISMAVIALTDNILLMMAALAAPVAVGWSAVKGDFLHPIIWFGLAYMLYSDAGPLLGYMGLNPIIWGGYQFDLSDYVKAMRVEGLAGIAAFLAIGINIVDVRRPLREANEHWKISSFAWPMFLLTLVGSLALVRFIAASGFADKFDLIARGGVLTRVSFLFIFLSTSSVLLIVREASINRRPLIAWLIVAGVSVFFILVVLTMGQRNYFFRWVVLLAMLASAYGFRFRLWMMTAGTAVGGLLMAAMNYMKMSLVRSTVAPEDAAVVGGMMLNFMTRIGLVGVTKWTWAMWGALFTYVALSAEFSTPGTNLALLIGHWPTGMPPYGPEVLWDELLTSFLPGFLNAVPDRAVAQVVFINMFFPGALEMGKGYGCGIVPEGYMIWGTPGAILLLGLVGLIIRWAYRRAATGIISLLFYINVAPIVAFALRADMTSLFSQSWKHAWLPLLVIYFANRLRIQYRVLKAERAGSMLQPAE